MGIAQRLARNTIASYVGTLSVFAVSLFLVPYTINKLGSTQYGVWALILSTFGFLALVDFGLANALAKYTAEYSSRNDRDTVERMASTLFFVFAAIGVVLFLGIAAFSFRFSQFFDVPVEYQADAQLAIVVMGLNIGLTLPLSIYNALMVGHQRYGLLNAGVVGKQVLLLVLTVLFLQTGWPLVGLAAASLIVTVAQAAWLRWSLRHVAQETMRIAVSRISRALLVIMLSYSVFMFVMMISKQLESSAGPIIVGRVVGLDAVTSFTIGGKVAGLVRQFTFPMTQALFPAFSALYALQDQLRVKLLLTQGLRVSALVVMPMAGFTAVLAVPLITLWIGPEYVGSAPIAVVLVFQVLANQLLMATSALLIGIGDLKLYMVLHLGALLFSVAFGVLAAPRLGELGVALGSMLAWTLVLVITVPYTARIAGVRLAELLSHALGRPAMAALIACAGLLLMRSWLEPDNLVVLFLQGGACTLLYAGLAWTICLSRKERTRFLGIARRYLPRASAGVS